MESIAQRAGDVSAPARAGTAAEERGVSRIEQVCGGVIEACWLAAVAIIPVFYNPHALTAFQPEKVILLRIFASIAACSWSVGAVERRGLRGSSLIRHPAVIAVLGLAAAYVAATCFSVFRSASLWGSPEYMQGTVTFFAGLVIFGAVAAHLRRREQWERLVTTVIAGSIPVALYAIIQRAGYDPLAMAIDPTRVVSTIGQPIFLAGYLLMVMPLTAWRIVRLTGPRSGAGSGRWRPGGAAFYTGVAVLELGAFICAQSRGPLLGLGASIVFMAVGLAVWRGRRRLIFIAAAVGVCGLGALLIPGVRNGLLSHWTPATGLSHFATLPLGATADTFRTDIWKEAPRLMLSHEPLPFPSGGADRLHWLRPFVGYGPETLANVLPHYYTVPDVNARIENRFHNLIWDTWFGLGGFGVAALMAFIVSLFHCGYSRLGWIGPGKSRVLFWALSVGGASAGAAGFMAWGGIGFAGLGLLAGLVAGLTVHPVLAGFTGGALVEPGGEADWSATLLIALLAAMAGHLVDMAFAFPTSATMLFFWVYAGGILALIHQGEPAAEERPEVAAMARTRGKRRREKKKETKAPAAGIDGRRVFECAIFSALILTAVAFAFVQCLTRDPMAIGSVLRAALERMAGGEGQSHLVWFLIIPTWVGVNFAFAYNAAGPKGIGLGRLFWAPAGMSGLWLWAYLLWKAWQLTAIGPVPGTDGTAANALAQCSGYEYVSLAFVAVVVGLGIFGGVLLAGPLKGERAGAAGWWMVAVGILAAIGLIEVLAIEPLRADMAAGWAKGLDGLGLSAQSAAVSKRVVALVPDSPVYLRMLAETLTDLAGNGPPADYEGTMGEAEAVLTKAREMTLGLDSATYQLGQLYLRWAGRESQPERQRALAQKASALFDQALIYQPLSAFVWNDSATADAFYLGRQGEADRKMRRVEEIVGGQVGDWGDYCRGLSVNASDPKLKEQYATEAMKAYESGIANPQEDAANAGLCRVGEATMLIANGKRDEALGIFLDSLKYPLGAGRWKAETALAVIYAGQGNLAAARQYVASALGDAPEGQKGELLQLQEQLEGRQP